MNDQADSQLLRTYAETHSETAFAELARRHVDLVYSAALRMVRDEHLAEDVTQGVFVALARSAAQLKDRAVLSGWLHRTAQNIAAQTVRTIERRRSREKEAAAMNELLCSEPESAWDQISPLLDTALGELNESDRDALLLRYFEKKSTHEMADILGISDDAAQKRVSRAVEKLREYFARRNIGVAAGGLVVVISANAVQSAPLALVATVSSAAIAGATLSTSTIIAATKAIAMTTLQKALIATTLTVLAGAGIYQAHQAVQLREQNETLLKQQALMAGQIRQLQNDNGSLSNRPVEVGEANNMPEELLKLRGQVGVLRGQTNEFGNLLEENRQLKKQLSAINSMSAKQLFFRSQQILSTDAANQLGHAIRQYADNNNDSYPTNFNQFMNIITNTMDMTPGAIGLNAFELVPDVTSPQPDNSPPQIILREIEPRQTQDGQWIRLYVFTDGRVDAVTSENGDFSIFEQQHNIISPRGGNH